MTSPFQPGQNPNTPAPGPRGRSLPTPPKGWPIGSYPTYAEAQRAVDYLSDQQFPVQQVTIVGVDLMQVELRLDQERLDRGVVRLGFGHRAKLRRRFFFLTRVDVKQPQGAIRQGVVRREAFHACAQLFGLRCPSRCQVEGSQG